MHAQSTEFRVNMQERLSGCFILRVLHANMFYVHFKSDFGRTNAIIRFFVLFVKQTK